MDFSVVIPTYNNLEELKGCLQALNGLRENDFEVHVCVDGSTDGTFEWLQEAEFSFPLLVHQHPGKVNRGRSATRNLSLSSLSGTYTLFLDSDMQADPALFDAHLEVLQSGNAISIGSVSYHNRKGNLWVRYSSERGVAKFSAGSEVPFQYFITANTAVPSRWIVELGGFDAKINRYGGEDMELGYRLYHEFKPRFVYNSAAVVRTVQPKTLQEALPQLREYGNTGLPYIVQKWPELESIYWVGTCKPRGLKEHLLNWAARPFWRPLAFFLLKITPFSIQKQLINYLVISHVHQGYRAALKENK